MYGQELNETDVETWTFEVEGFPLDAPQQAKKRVADENEDVRYRDLRARLVNNPSRRLGDTYVTVINVLG